MIRGWVSKVRRPRGGGCFGVGRDRAGWHCSKSSGTLLRADFALSKCALSTQSSGTLPRADFALSKCALLTEQWHADPPATDLCDDNGTCVGSGTPCNFLTHCGEDLEQCIPDGQDCEEDEQ